ncbi:MAG: hypothetical protein HY360_24815 [Verrucomicrobia bacterium]|nr:hypothetical protein [Verrucomicrobiota bacterium]
MSPVPARRWAPARGRFKWAPPALILPAEDRRLNGDGTSTRLAITGMRFWGHEEIFQPLGAFESVNFDWPITMADGSNGPEQYTYSETDQYLALLDQHGKVRKGNFIATFGAGYMVPSPDG